MPLPACFWRIAVRLSAHFAVSFVEIDVSVELHVFVSDPKIPDHLQWQNALQELGIRLTLPTDFMIRKQSGYLPVRWNGRKTGFEFFLGPVGTQFKDLKDKLGARDHIATFVPRDEVESGAAIAAAAGLAWVAGGVFFDPQGDGLLMNASDLVAAAKRYKAISSVEEDGSEFDAGGLRERRKGDAFDHELDGWIVPILTEHGCIEVEPYTFSRAIFEGKDVIFFGVYEDKFYVVVCFVPQYMREIAELSERLPGGMPRRTGGLLAPTLVLRPDAKKLYPMAASKLDNSIRLVGQGLSKAAFQWLITQRDPRTYAEHVASSGGLAAARAWEYAGTLPKARELYQRQLDSLLKTFEMCGSPAEFHRGSVARESIYVCLKLQTELVRCAHAMQGTGFRPRVTPLPIIS
jgi:hypothetical protein